jgi:hypothetical protein
VRFLPLAAIVCEGENCTTIIKFFAILGQFTFGRICVMYFRSREVKNHFTVTRAR